MDRITPQKPRQPRPEDSARPELPYIQLPTALLRLPPGERAAAIEVWATLHGYLRLGSQPQRVTDEMLAASPYLAGRSTEHGRKGLEILERDGLITRSAKGSRREVAVVARLRSAKTGHAMTSNDSMSNRVEIMHRHMQDTDPALPDFGKSFWETVRELGKASSQKLPS